MSVVVEDEKWSKEKSVSIVPDMSKLWGLSGLQLQKPCSCAGYGKPQQSRVLTATKLLYCQDLFHISDTVWL